MLSNFKVINKSLNRIDAYEKVTGELKYGGDMKFTNMLNARPVYSKYSHAKVVSINIDKAKKLYGVAYIATAKDLPGEKTIGEAIQDQYVLVVDRVRYEGDVLAVVAAESEEIAREAAELVEVEYKELPVLSTTEDALRNNSVVIHEQYPDNICASHKVRKGNIERGFSESDVIIEEEYETQYIEHAYIEPEVVIAVPGPKKDEICVVGSIQNPHVIRRSLSRTLKIPLSKVRIVQQALGGTFGGKLETIETMSVRVALLSLITGRPIKMAYKREDSIREHHKRHPYKMKYKIGATSEGKICAVEADIITDSGPYACMTPFVTRRSSVQGCGPYNIDNIKFDIKGVYTNNPYTGSMRGFGAPQVVFAIESIITELTEKLNISPYKIRKINTLKTGDVSTTGQLLNRHVVSIDEVLGKVNKEADFESKWKEYNKIQKGHIRKGIGIACSLRGVALSAGGLDLSRAIISIEEDGSIILSIGLTEQGQGLKTVMSQIAAEALGVSYKRIHFMDNDTSRTPDSGQTVASRGTIMGGNAVIDAAKKIKKVITESVVEKYKISEEEIVFSNDNIIFGKQVIPFDEIVRYCYDIGKTLMAVGFYKAPEVKWNEKEGKDDGYFTFVYQAQVAEVEVNMLTGKTEVLKVVAAHDVGRAINPQAVEGQIFGGVIMSLGYALMEELNVKDTNIGNLNFDRYLIPTSMDVPKIVPIIVENPDPDGPFGAKCVGESVVELGVAAIINAINQAIGKKIRKSPASLERVFLGHSLKK